MISCGNCIYTALTPVITCHSNLVFPTTFEDYHRPHGPRTDLDRSSLATKPNASSKLNLFCTGFQACARASEGLGLQRLILYIYVFFSRRVSDYNSFLTLGNSIQELPHIPGDILEGERGPELQQSLSSRSLFHE